MARRKRYGGGGRKRKGGLIATGKMFKAMSYPKQMAVREAEKQIKAGSGRTAVRTLASEGVSRAVVKYAQKLVGWQLPAGSPAARKYGARRKARAGRRSRR